MKAGVFALTFGSWFALVQLGRADGHVNLLLFAACVLVVTHVVQGRHPFSTEGTDGGGPRWIAPADTPPSRA